MSAFSLRGLKTLFNSSAGSPHSSYTALPTGSALSPPLSPPSSNTLSFVVLGASVLLPWNVLLCLFPHFIALLTPSSPTLALSLPSSLSLLATGTNFLALAYLTFRSSARAAEPKRDPNTRIRSSLWALVGLHGALVLAILLIGRDARDGGAMIVLGGLGLWSVGVMWVGSYLQAGVMECATLFGPMEIGAVQAGMGLIAVAVSSVQVISSVAASSASSVLPPSASLAGPKHDAGDTFWSTILFVSIGTLFLFYTLYISAALARRSQAIVLPSTAPSSPTLNAASSTSKLPATSTDILLRNALINITIASVYIVTLAVFPALTVRVAVKGTDGWWKARAVWVPFGLFMFNAGDFLGRTLPSIIPLITSQASLFAFALLRVLFVPFFAHASSATSTVGDGVFLLSLGLLGLSNGYVATNAMILSSTPGLNKNIEPDERELAGLIATFCLVGGLVGGSALSFGVVAYVG